MDFFTHQDRARRKTFILACYFLLSVVVIVLAVYGAFLIAFMLLQAEMSESAQVPEFSIWQPRMFALVTAGTVLLITFGSTYKIWSLSGGGDNVATMLGGRPIPPDTRDPDERKLLNVVEEMAIASGTPVPPVYLLQNEGGINAFAAGYDPEDAVIGVTRGCVQRLDREELQGVIAHEFSHILNGDMRINIRLMGVLFGILLIGIGGYTLLRMSFFGGQAGGARRRGKDGRAALAFMLLGVMLLIIGYIGVFFGRLIKSSLSRQREYLADASAVQFTRYPDGIASALKKIGGLTRGARLSNSNAEEASHMFFGNALRSSMFNALSTHPPLDERIRRIDPSWDGSFPVLEDQEERPVDRLQQQLDQRREPTTPRQAQAGMMGMTAMAAAVAASQPLALEAKKVISQIGQPGPEHLQYARDLKESIPPALVDTAHEAYGARAIVYGLLLDAEKDIRDKQLKGLEQHADKAVYRETVKRLEDFDELEPRQRLMLIDMALPALQSLSPEQFKTFRENIQRLIEADERIDILEFAMQRIVVRHLKAKIEGAQRPRARYYSLNPLREELSVLLSTLAYVGEPDMEAARRAFAMGVSQLRLPDDTLHLIPKDALRFQALGEALDKLREITPPHKRFVIQACVACIAADRRAEPDEVELLRAIGDTLGCPIPPILPGQTL